MIGLSLLSAWSHDITQTFNIFTVLIQFHIVEVATRQPCTVRELLVHTHSQTSLLPFHSLHTSTTHTLCFFSSRSSRPDWQSQLRKPDKGSLVLLKEARPKLFLRSVIKTNIEYQGLTHRHLGPIPLFSLDGAGLKEFVAILFTLAPR